MSAAVAIGPASLISAPQRASGSTSAGDAFGQMLRSARDADAGAESAPTEGVNVPAQQGAAAPDVAVIPRPSFASARVAGTWRAQKDEPRASLKRNPPGGGGASAEFDNSAVSTDVTADNGGVVAAGLVSPMATSSGSDSPGAAIAGVLGEPSVAPASAPSGSLAPGEDSFAAGARASGEIASKPLLSGRVSADAAAALPRPPVLSGHPEFPDGVSSLASTAPGSFPQRAVASGVVPQGAQPSGLPSGGGRRLDGIPADVAPAEEGFSGPASPIPGGSGDDPVGLPPAGVSRGASSRGASLPGETAPGMSAAGTFATRVSSPGVSSSGVPSSGGSSLGASAVGASASGRPPYRLPAEFGSLAASVSIVGASNQGASRAASSSEAVPSGALLSGDLFSPGGPTLGVATNGATTTGLSSSAADEAGASSAVATGDIAGSMSLPTTSLAEPVSPEPDSPPASAAGPNSAAGFDAAASPAAANDVASNGLSSNGLSSNGLSSIGPEVAIASGGPPMSVPPSAAIQAAAAGSVADETTAAATAPASGLKMARSGLRPADARADADASPSVTPRAIAQRPTTGPMVAEPHRSAFADRSGESLIDLAGVDRPSGPIVPALAAPSQAAPPQAAPSQAAPSQAAPSQAAATDPASARPAVADRKNAPPAADAASIPGAPVAGDASALAQAFAPAAPPSFTSAPPTAATPQHAAAAPPPAEQIAHALLSVAKGADGSQQMTIRLHPVELGMVQVRIERAVSGLTQIEISADKPETLQTLQRDQAALHHTLDQAGVPAAGRTITFHGVPLTSASSGSLGSGHAGGQDGPFGRQSGAGADAGTSSGGGKGSYGREASRWSGGRPETPASVPGAAAASGQRTLRSGLDITA